MESRGLPRLTARTKRGATLLWALFFIFSIGLQYMSALAPASVEAASLTAPIPGLMPTSPQANAFEIDGDPLSGNANANPGGLATTGTWPPASWGGLDWFTGPHGSGVVSAGQAQVIHDLTNSTSDDSYSGGQKETDTSNWVIGPHPVPSKDDIADVYASTQVVNAHRYLYIGSTRIVNNGDTTLDFEFNQKAATGDIPNRS
ncbi:MAG: hypothetical protein ACXWNG_06245, partial [Candidatus Limnocylindrales bacterium]